MKVLLLGGTSFFGKDIARLFHQAGHSVTLFTRGQQKPSDLPALNGIVGDREKPADLERAARAESWDLVIDNIAYTAQHVEQALTAFAGIKRYLLCSTVSVYRFVRDRYPQPLKETAVDYDYSPPEEIPDDIHWKYARGKLEAERAVIRQTRVPWTILRPPVVYGPYDVTDRGFWYLGRLQQGGPMLLASDGSASFRLSYSVDVARAFLDAAQTTRTIGHIYNTAQSEIITLRDFIEESARALSATTDLISIPIEFLGDLGGPYSTMPNLVQDNSAAERDFGYRTTPWTEFAAITAAWFRDHWKGDPAKLYATRREELALAQQWRESTARFRAI
jgi:nucleoside-diphosphate-sugar epimerase